ncbi:M20 aminoacylase family protein [Paraburkholderia phymatum]|uniref:M20 aminoacylase family protein n=1 Tax=Paraburkholderia phymatum TaxID=148447 RepID=A0ACC6UC26_9BURK
MILEETTIAEATEWRRDFHRHPELLFDVDRTAKRVAELLCSFGCDEVASGIGRSGVVAVVRGSEASDSRMIGIRADMDALPIREDTALPYASTCRKHMHACGHDGHMAMLLGAVKHLAATRAFRGTLVAIFQPAEEGGGGAKVMIDDGLFERFPVDEVYALHNMPGLDVGTFALSSDVMFAASDRFDIRIVGKGGHAARPHETIDPIHIASHLIYALQTVVSRKSDPVDPIVVSVTSIHAGEAYNVIPADAILKGSVRTLSEACRDNAEKCITEMAKRISAAFGAAAEVEYRRGYPPTVNHFAQARILGEAAARVVGDAAVQCNMRPIMGAEDFSYMLKARPGAVILMGNGQTAPLHHPKYDFNDKSLPLGMALWINVVTQGSV